ncbi:MAG: hypothetical protein Q7R54_03360 [bacterium]|nr:hypothetical protein [bacterium]
MAEVLELKGIVEAGMQAPSGDNMQPWKFSVSHEGVDVYIDPTGLHSVYDFRRRGSLAAIGTAIENMLIAAKRFGKTATLKLFPSDDDPNHIAHIGFTADSGAGRPEDAPLYEHILTRGTNRRLYKDIPLTNEQRSALLSIPVQMGIGGSVHLVEEPKRRAALAKLLSNNDKLLFMNRPLHDGLFKYFRWTPEEIESTRDGLDVQTLEFPPSDQKTVRLLRSWGMTKFMNLFGAAGMIAKKTEKIYGTGAALVAITMKGASEEDFVQGGRIMERLWLTITGMGLAIHPAFGFALLGQRVLTGETAMFSPSQIKLVKESFNNIRDLFEVGDETIVMLFRLGTPEGPPSARSVRKYPEAVVTYKT